MSFFCFAHSQVDSARIVQKLDKLEQVNKETKELLKRSAIIDRQNQTLIYKIKKYIEKISSQNRYSERLGIESDFKKSQAIKPFNNEPTIEVEIPDGVDSIRGNFFYRLFHKQIFIIKPFKIVNDEKIYLD